MSLERKHWIDLLKGLLIILVVLGHTLTNKIALNWLSSFYMPCFFILSGWVMKKTDDIKGFMLKKIKSILLPYVFFSMIWIAFCFAKEFVLKSGYNVFSALISIVLPYSGRVSGNVYNLWFLPCLFLSQMIIILLLSRKNIYRIVAVVLWIAFLVLGITIAPCCSLLYAVAVATVFVGFGYFVSKQLFDNFKDKSLFFWLILIVVGLLIHAGGFYINSIWLKNDLDFSSTQYGILPIFILCAIGASVACIAAVSRLKQIKVLQYIGRNSLVYYALHYEVLAVVSFVLEKVLNINWLIVLAGFIVTVILTSVVVCVYNKLNVNKLFN